jgi:LCP family protein required for cell wall assembly
MDFKTRRIRYKKNDSIIKKVWRVAIRCIKSLLALLMGNKKKKKPTGLIVGVIIIVVLFFYGCSSIISRIGLINVIGIFGEELMTDTYGNTNVLLLGTGGEGHDGADLTDTIIVASIDQSNKLVPMLSIPRDFYVNVDEIGGGARINRVFEMGKHKYGTEKGIELIEKAIEEITDIEIHYHVLINFSGFKEIVDSLDGVEINIDEAIYDPYYPLDGTILYQTFSLDEGLQHLDGETALKYVRSRKTTSDFDRSKRQQKLLFAIKEKAMSKNILLNPGKIKDLYYSVNDNIETNFSIRHIIELAKISQNFSRENIVSRVITDDPTSCGGFLYVPEREFFGGAFVLIPIGNDYDFIHQYADLIFHYPEINKNPLQFQVLNGTKTGGLAGETKAMLDRLCFDVIRFGNAQSQDIEKTNIFYKTPMGTSEEIKETESNKIPEELYFINQLIPGEISTDVPLVYLEEPYKSEANIILELGANYADSKPEDIFYQYYPSESTTSTSEEEEEEDTEELSDEL